MINVRVRARFLIVVALAVCAGAIGVAAQEAVLAPPKQDADRMAAKLELIRRFAQAPPAASRPSQQVVLTALEVNAYLWWHLAEIVPSGITEPHLDLPGDGRVFGRATVDLTAIRNQKARGWLDPLAYVGGRVPVTASGILRTHAGIATLEFTEATVAGVSVPKSVLQELVTYYSRTPQNPRGVNLDDPFPLPGGIKEIQVGKGEAAVMQ